MKSRPRTHRKHRAVGREIFVFKSRKLPERSDKLSSNITTERAFSSLGSFSPSFFRFAPKWIQLTRLIYRNLDARCLHGNPCTDGSIPPSPFPYSSLFSFSLCVAFSILVKCHGGHLYKIARLTSIIHRSYKLQSRSSFVYNRAACTTV